MDNWLKFRIFVLQSTTMNNTIKEKLSTLFPHIKVTKNQKTIYASSLLDKGGNPIVRINYKEPIEGLMIKMNDNSIEIKSIVNSSGKKGLTSKVVDILTESTNTIIIDQDQSNGFWDHFIQKYPKVTFIKK